MDKDRINGSTKQIKDDAKQGFWKIVGDSMLEADRTADGIEGRVQDAVVRGKIKNMSKET